MRYKDQILTRLESIEAFIERFERNVAENLPLTNAQKLETTKLMRERVEGIKDLIDLEQND